MILNAFYGDKGNLQQLLRSQPTRYLRHRDRLAEVVSSERTIQGLSRDELAARAKTSKDVVALIEQGRDPRSIGGTVRVLRALGVRASALPNWEMEK
ncbi:hypothetical protein [Agreia sp.]|uniref:hypothetical protein n=1 Tax=Agreia sp. TaxID=1872416 RepID=UPI0035BC71B5